MQKKILFLFISILSAIPFANAAVDTTPVPTLDYIINAGSGVYSLYGKNIPSDRNLVNVYIDNKKVDQTNVVLTKEGINVRNFYRDSGSFMIERLKVTYGSGEIAKYSTDKKTNSLKIRGNSITGFDGQFFRENKDGYDIVRIPFLNEIPLGSSEGMLADRKIVINGQDKPLIPFVGEYKDGIYYFTAKEAIFLEKNLPERLNAVGFKLDGLSSNFVTIRKEWIILESPSGVEIEDIWSSKNIKVTFTEPKNFINLTGKEVYVNGTKIDNEQVTVGLNQLIIKYDILHLSKDQDHLSIILKDTLTNQYSNEQIVSIEKFSRFLITEIDTGKWTSGIFTFVIHGNMNALFGDVYNFKININGTDYTRDGIQEAVKNGSGVIQKDSNGVNKFITKNKIEFKKTGAGIEFDFFYNQLKAGENILFIKNQNTGRESNKVSFTIGSTPVINYNYLTGAILTEMQKKETLTFEIGKDFEKKPNSANLAPTDRNISFGKIKSTYLKNNEFYNMEFLLDTDLAINPFSSLKLDTMNLEIVKNNGKISFLFKKQWFGKDFKASMELLGTINELYNVSSKTFSLTIKEISLKKLSKEDIFETIISIKNPLKASIFYFYTRSNCFDGTKDFCSIIGEVDPSLAINYSSSGTPITIVAPTQVVPPPSTASIVSATGTTTKIVRRNISTVVLQDFGNEKFKRVQDVLVQKYEALKKKGSAFATTFRNATNNLLLALKNYEMNIDRTTSIAQVGSSLKTINEALRQAKKE